jgi:hexokinase
MNKKIQKFLSDHQFFSYQDREKYADSLELQIKSSLSKHNTNQIHFPKKWGKCVIPVEQPEFIGLDLGGTFLRLNICNSKKGRFAIVKETKISFYQNKIYTPEILFGDLKNHLDLFLKDFSPRPTRLIFSFANALHPFFRKKNKLDGETLFWGKNHRQSGLLGINLGEELENYLRLNGYPNLDVYTINDSSLALLSAKLSQQENYASIINLVVGSGTNISVGYDTKTGFKTVNLEFGNFDFVPYSNFDNQLNHQSSTPNKFRTEKLFSGTWQNFLFTIILERGVTEGVLPTDSQFDQLKKMTSLQLEDFFQSKPKDFPAFNDLKQIWTEINLRGSTICAIAVAGIVKYLVENHLVTKGLTILEVGALLEHSKDFRKNFEKTLLAQLSADKTTKKTAIELILSVNPTCLGSLTLLTFCKP